MARLESLGKVHNADILIVGGGLAGLWAAIRALQCRPDLSVLVVDAAYIGKSGHAYFAQGQLVTWLPEKDDLDEWVEDVARGNEWLCPQDMVEDCLKNSLARIEDHERFGIRYHRRKGTYWRQLCRGLTKVKLIHSPQIGGQGMMLARGEVGLLKRLVLGADQKTHCIGWMDAKKMQASARITLEARNVDPKGVDVAGGWTNEFLPCK